ncbi:hypothetical protein ACFSTC_00970 [Nonomuraea ferruginea]
MSTKLDGSMSPPSSASQTSGEPPSRLEGAERVRRGRGADAHAPGGGARAGEVHQVSAVGETGDVGRPEPAVARPGRLG